MWGGFVCRCAAFVYIFLYGSVALYFARIGVLYGYVGSCCRLIFFVRMGLLGGLCGFWCFACRGCGV